jgi:hypothetical protein
MLSELILAALRALVAGAAGVVLWTAWRGASRGGDPWATRIVTAGFLLRAVAGILLFWISYLRLPVMTSQYLGWGFWVFALDSTYYMPLARAAASPGLFAIVTLDRGAWSSVSYLQILSLAQILFGYVTSVGLLLNSACFLGGALSLVRWSASLGPAGRYPGLLALTVLSLHPSWILWSTQPLKDPLFGLLVIAWFYASRYWYDSSVQRGAGWRRVLSALVLAAVLYELAGMRAYFALILWLAFGAGLVLSLLQASPVRRWRRVVVSALLWMLLSQVVVGSGGPLLPPTVRAFLMPYESGGEELKVGNAGREAVAQKGGEATRERPKETFGEQAKRVLLRPLVTLREGFVSSGGSSQITGSAAAGRQAAQGGPPANLPVAPPAPTQEWSSDLLTGLAATFLPRAVGRSLGLFSIGGGREAWAYVELDTLFFVFGCVLSGWLTVRAARRAGRTSPLALQALLSALLIAVGLAYVVTNYGTLFRLRELILMPLSLAPLAATLGSERERETAARVPG